MNFIEKIGKSILDWKEREDQKSEELMEIMNFLGSIQEIEIILNLEDKMLKRLSKVGVQLDNIFESDNIENTKILFFENIKERNLLEEELEIKNVLYSLILNKILYNPKDLCGFDVFLENELRRYLKKTQNSNELEY